MSSRTQAISNEREQQGEVAPSRDKYERTFDLAVATIGLFLLSPLFLLVAIAILIEDGRPVFFFQERVGRNKERFRLCKFRSMVDGADENLHRHHVTEVLNSSTNLRILHDSRVTKVGKIIRRWSLDELPNLWNVVRGDMSLVGPRPLVPYEADAIEPAYRRRFLVRPGVTGLAQVSGRLEMTHEERLDLDLAYARQRSLLRDVKIIAKTIPSMMKLRG